MRGTPTTPSLLPLLIHRIGPATTPALAALQLTMADQLQSCALCCLSPCGCSRHTPNLGYVVDGYMYEEPGLMSDSLSFTSGPTTLVGTTEYTTPGFELGLNTAHVVDVQSWQDPPQPPPKQPPFRQVQSLRQTHATLMPVTGVYHSPHPHPHNAQLHPLFQGDGQTSQIQSGQQPKPGPAKRSTSQSSAGSEGEVYVCICSKAFRGDSARQNLWRHKRWNVCGMNGKKVEANCEECPKKFQRSDALANHKYKVHKCPKAPKKKAHSI